MGTAETVIHLADVSAVLEHGPCTFELVLKSGAGRRPSGQADPQPFTLGSEDAAPGGLSGAPTEYVFEALTPESRAKWVGKLRGLEQFLQAKEKLLENAAWLGQTGAQAVTMFRSKYDEVLSARR
mmetsp:Transcript_16754/g.27238  ORF Transcript_16754/g.27238 Transcript_16754/m.27238 type:complete len:125 (-) Transcript_16754:216-590(-)